jgi:(1->4)-alpha-D-glucan 1-alpha-D-glucosylmutase
VLSRADEGAPKLRVVERALALRGERPHAYGGEGGGYEPVVADGPQAAHLVGFVRGGEVAVVVPRLVVGLERAGGWGDTSLTLPGGRWRNVLDGREWEGGAALALADALQPFPVALLVRESA